MVTIAPNDLDSLFNDLPCLKDASSRFSPESPVDYIYNCIAWAMGTNVIWVGGNLIPWYWWPKSVPLSEDKQCLVDAFKALGFEECNDDTFEEGYRKVALYAIGVKWTHAARVLDSNLYHSKFGCNCDGFHSSNPLLFDGTCYGRVFKYMKRLLTKENITTSLTPNSIPPFVNRSAWSNHLKELRKIKYYKLKALGKI